MPSLDPGADIFQCRSHANKVQLAQTPSKMKRSKNAPKTVSFPTLTRAVLLSGQAGAPLPLKCHFFASQPGLAAFACLAITPANVART